MEFVFEKFNQLLTEKQSVKNYFVVRPKNKHDRRDVSKFLKRVQYNWTHVTVKLTTFPKVNNKAKYNFYDPENNLREDVVETIRRLNTDGILVVAEVHTTSY